MTFLSAALLSGGSIIDLDGTIFVQLAIFFLAFFILRSLVFKPMMQLFDAREEAIDGARREAKELVREAEEKGASFEGEMHDVRREAGEERDKLRAEGMRLEREMLEKVRAETAQTLSAAEEKMQKEADQVRTEMKTQVPLLARQIASRLLGREVS
jgi:F-type H+-transporting ATPase subunit b